LLSYQNRIIQSHTQTHTHPTDRARMSAESGGPRNLLSYQNRIIQSHTQTHTHTHTQTQTHTQTHTRTCSPSLRVYFHHQVILFHHGFFGQMHHLNHPGHRRGDGRFHFHGLDDKQGVVFLHPVAFLDIDAGEVALQGGTDFGDLFSFPVFLDFDVYRIVLDP